MAATDLHTATTLVDIRFESPMNRDHIAGLEAAGVRMRGVHDPNRQMVGTGFIGPEAGLVVVALTREGSGYRLQAITHEPQRCDRTALVAWEARVRTVLPGLASGGQR